MSGGEVMWVGRLRAAAGSQGPAARAAVQVEMGRKSEQSTVHRPLPSSKLCPRV